MQMLVAWAKNDQFIHVPSQNRYTAFYADIEKNWTHDFPNDPVPRDMCKTIGHQVREYLRMKGMDERYQRAGYAVNVFNQSALIEHVTKYLKANCHIWKLLSNRGLAADHHWIMAVRRRQDEISPESERFRKVWI